MNADNQDFKYKVQLTEEIIRIFYLAYNKLGYGFWKMFMRMQYTRTNLLKEFINLLEDGYSVESGLTKLNFSNPIMTP